MVSRLDVAVREGGNGGRIRARPTACLPPHQGEGRGGGGLPVSRIVVEPVRTETHPHPTLPLQGRASMRLRSGSLSPVSTASRSEERRVGQDGVRTCISQWWTSPYKK